MANRSKRKASLTKQRGFSLGEGEKSIFAFNKGDA